MTVDSIGCLFDITAVSYRWIRPARFVLRCLSRSECSFLQRVLWCLNNDARHCSLLSHRQRKISWWTLTGCWICAVFVLCAVWLCIEHINVTVDTAADCFPQMALKKWLITLYIIVKVFSWDLVFIR